MAKIKGTILIDFVKTIKADKTGVYDSYLTDKDKEVVSSRILPSGWYDYETFRNCFNAVVNVLAKNDMDAIRQWGRIFGENIVTGVYQMPETDIPREPRGDKYGIFRRCMAQYQVYQ